MPKDPNEIKKGLEDLDKLFENKPEQKQEQTNKKPEPTETQKKAGENFLTGLKKIADSGISTVSRRPKKENGRTSAKNLIENKELNAAAKKGEEKAKEAAPDKVQKYGIHVDEKIVEKAAKSNKDNQQDFGKLDLDVNKIKKALKGVKEEKTTDAQAKNSNAQFSKINDDIGKGSKSR